MSLWTVVHGFFWALALATADGLLLKFDRPWSAWVPAALVSLMALAILLHRMAIRRPPELRGAEHRMWSGLDRHGFVWLAVLVVLLWTFHHAFNRASGDGREYFSQLRSVVMDQDVQFDNERRDFGSQDPGTFPFGSALLWLPFYLLARGWMWLLNAMGAEFDRTGYSYPYQMAVGLGTLTYGLIGLVLVWRVATDYFSRTLALAATLTVTVASFLVWYLAVDNSYTHGNSLFAVTLFLYLWHRTRAARPVGAWLALGASAGLMIMVRWQNAVFVLPVALDLVVAAWRALRHADLGLAQTLAVSTLAFGAALILALSPQMYVWKVTNGGWLTLPHGQAGQQWWHDSLVLDVLFSSNHGLVAWHPVIYLALLGVPLFARHDWRLGATLSVLFGAQVYINGAVTTWWGGTAYGGRRFEACTLLFVLGFAALLRWVRDRPAVALSALLLPFVLVNLFLMRDAYAGRVPLGEGITIDGMLGTATRRLGNPFSFPATAVRWWQDGIRPDAYDRLGLNVHQNVRIDAGSPGDERFLLDGWSAPEVTGDWTFRWAIGRRSTVAVPLMGPRYTPPGRSTEVSDYVLILRAQPFVVEGAEQTLSVLVNGRPVGVQQLDADLREYTFPVPGRHLHRNINVLTFTYGYARQPREFGGTDDRPLSVRFDRIDFVLRPSR